MPCFQVWLEECYQVKPHSGLENSMSPEVAYRSDKHALKFLDPDIITQAFLHCEERKVDKSGCISFQNQKYEVGLNFIGSKVNVVFDPADTRELTIEYEGHTPFTAKPLVIGERTGKRPKMPEHMQAVPAESSRLLAAASEKNKNEKSIVPPPSLTSPCTERGRPLMFEGFYGMSQTPFSRDIPTGELYDSPMLEETIGRLEYASHRQQFAVSDGRFRHRQDHGDT